MSTPAYGPNDYVLCTRQTKNAGMRVLGVAEKVSESPTFLVLKYHGRERAFSKQARREVRPRPNSRLTYLTFPEFHASPLARHRAWMADVSKYPRYQMKLE